MHIVIIPAWYEKQEEGHTGIFIRDLAAQYAKRGHKVSVLICKLGGDTTELSVVKDPAGFSEYYHYYKDKPSLWNKLKFPKKVLNAFDQYVIENGKPDIINSQAFVALGHLDRIRNKYDIPIIHSEHLGSFMHDRLPLFFKIRAKLYFKRANHIIAVSNTLAFQLRKLTKVPISFISGMVNPEFFIPTLIDSTPATARLICVSDLDVGKGHDMLLRAAAILSAREIDYQLSLIGEGPELENLLALTKELEIQKDVIFLGRKTRTAIIAELLQSDLYVSATKSESFGAHIAEGLSMGLYAVITDCGGPESYINEMNGVIVRNYAALDLADAIEIAIVEKDSFSKEEIRDSIELLAAPKVVIPQIEDIFDLYSV